MKYNETNVQKSDNLAEVQISYKSKVKPADRLKVTSSKDAFEALKNCFSSDTIEHSESFVILLLNRNNAVLGWAKISSGGLSSCVVDHRVIFQIALNANASGIILSHNHPSGNTQPSEQDKVITKRISEAGKILEINVLDHLILTNESYLSLMDEGLM